MYIRIKQKKNTYNIVLCRSVSYLISEIHTTDFDGTYTVRELMLQGNSKATLILGQKPNIFY